MLGVKFLSKFIVTNLDIDLHHRLVFGGVHIYGKFTWVFILNQMGIFFVKMS